MPAAHPSGQAASQVSVSPGRNPAGPRTRGEGGSLFGERRRLAVRGWPAPAGSAAGPGEDVGSCSSSRRGTGLGRGAAGGVLLGEQEEAGQNTLGPGEGATRKARAWLRREAGRGRAAGTRSAQRRRR